MNLITKIAGIIILTCLTFISIQYGNYRFFVNPTLEELELAFVEREMAHSQHLIEQQKEEIEAFSSDWAIWDDAYHFLKGTNNSFIAKNLNDETLKSIGMNGMLWIKPDFKLHFGLLLDKHFAQSPNLLSEFHTQHSTIFEQLIQQGINREDPTSGLLVFNQAVYFIAVQQVLTSDAQGPLAGWLIMIQQVPENLFTAHLSQLDTKTQLNPLDLFASSSTQADIEIPNVIYQADNMRLTANAYLTDIYGKPNILLSSNMPRDIIRRGEHIFNNLFITELSVTFAIAVILFLFLRNHISAPISKLIREIDQAPSLEQVNISDNPRHSGELHALTRMLRAAVDKLNVYLNRQREFQERTNQQNRLLFDLANDKDLSDGHLHHAFYKILSTFVNQTESKRASIWLMDQDMKECECYACFSTSGDNVETGVKVNTNQLTQSLLKKLIRQRSFLTQLNKQVTQNLLGVTIYDMAIISPIILNNQVKGALIAEFEESQIDLPDEDKLFLASLSELCSNSLYAHERKRLQDQLIHLAHHDPLTNLPNRSFFEEIAKKSIARSERDASGFSLLFIDLDKFKPVNDTYGHGVGDQLLKQVAERLKKRIRTSDTVARIGGDEFLILLEQTNDVSNARIIANEILESLSQVFEIEEHKVRISCSIGIALFPSHGNTLDELITASDHAMYAAKESGRSGIVIAETNSLAS